MTTRLEIDRKSLWHSNNLLDYSMDYSQFNNLLLWMRILLIEQTERYYRLYCTIIIMIFKMMRQYFFIVILF